MNVLRGRVYGLTLNELLLNARVVAATYFEVNLNTVSVTLSDATFAPLRGAGVDNHLPRFEAEFRAVVSP